MTTILEDLLAGAERQRRGIPHGLSLQLEIPSGRLSLDGSPPPLSPRRKISGSQPPGLPAHAPPALCTASGDTGEARQVISGPAGPLDEGEGGESCSWLEKAPSPGGQNAWLREACGSLGAARESGESLAAGSGAGSPRRIRLDGGHGICPAHVSKSPRWSPMDSISRRIGA